MYWQDNPQDAPVKAGWLMPEGRRTDPDARSLAVYIDYGPDCYRAAHKWCREGACDCALSQPGTVLAVVYHPKREARGCWGARYFEAIGEARNYAEQQVANLLSAGMLQAA